MSAKGKNPVTSKTIAFNLVSLIAGVCALHFGFDVSPEQIAIYSTVIQPVVNIALRFVTKVPLEV